MAWRILSREAKIWPNEVTGRDRAGFGLRGIGEGSGTFNAAGSGGGVAAAETDGDSATKTGSAGKDGDEISSGVVTRGGNGCTQLRLTFGCDERGVERGVTVRGRTGGGG